MTIPVHWLLTGWQGKAKSAEGGQKEKREAVLEAKQEEELLN